MICFISKGGYPARLKNVFIISPPLWFRAVLKFFSNFLQDKLKERVEVVSKQSMLQRFPESSIPESLGGTLKVNHPAWLNDCLASYSETATENPICNGAVMGDSVRNVRHINKDLSSASGGLRNEGAFTVIEFVEHMMNLTRKGIHEEFVELKRQAGTHDFTSAK